MDDTSTGMSQLTREPNLDSELSSLVKRATSWASHAEPSSQDTQATVQLAPSAQKSADSSGKQEDPRLVQLANAITLFVTDEIMRKLGYPPKNEEK